MKLVFMGTPDFAGVALEALIAAGHEIAAVYSQPPRKAHRGQAETPSPVHRLALARGLRVFTPPTLRDAEAQRVFEDHGAQAAVVAAYGLLLPKLVLEAPDFGCLNIHASLLPRWRGAAPIARAIMAGDGETGVSIMKMDAGLDTGPVALTARVPIDDTTTAGALHDRLAALGAALMCEALDLLARGALDFAEQPAEGASYARKLTPEEQRIAFAAESRLVLRQIHGLAPRPGAWCEMPLAGRRQRVKVLGAVLAEGSGPPGLLLDDRLTVACGQGALRLTELQREGRASLLADAFLRGAPVAAGDRIG